MAENLLQKLIDSKQYPLLDKLPIDSFLEQYHEVVLFFAEDPSKYPETNDVAMILPELEKAFHGRFQPVIVGKGIEKELQNKYGFYKWPALVFIRDGGYLGHICKVQNWDEYLQTINQILNGKAKPAESLIIPVAQ